jgi:hypothetical protein
MKNRVLTLILAILIILSWSSQGLSHEEKIHQAINEFIAQNVINGFSLNNYLIDNLGLNVGVQELLLGVEADGVSSKKEIFKWLGYGGIQEDRPGSISDYILGRPTRSVNHFHNPLKEPWDDAGLDDNITIPSLSPPYFINLHYTGQSSILWAQNRNQDPGGTWSWHDARKYYYTALTGRDIDGRVLAPRKEDREKLFARTFRAVGQLMHLVHDGSIPEHVRNDIHVLPAYEAKVEEFRTNRTKYPLLWDSFLAKPVAFDKSILDIVSTHPSAPVPISRIIDTDLYKGNNPDITKTKSNSPQPVGIAEYTNANFLSPDTMFTDRFDPNDGHYFPYPRAASAIHWKDDTNKRNYLGKTGEGDAVDHLALVSWFYSYRQRYFPQYDKYLPVGFDGKCYEEYASKLIPRAVGYSAGLLNYFFRGKLDVEQTGVTPGGEIEITITNLSEEPLVDGTFELYYDNKDGERAKLGLSATEVKGLQKEASFTASFRRPSDFEASKEDKYMLVYSGKMGLEEKAYIGKYGFIGRVHPAMVTYDPDEMKAFFKIGKRGEDETSHDFFIDLDPVLRELGHSVISPVSLKIVEYSGTLGALVYTVNETTYCVLMFEVLGLSSPEVEVNGYKKRDFVWTCEQFDMSSDTIDPIPPIPNLVYGTPGKPRGVADIWFYQSDPDKPHYGEYVQAVGVESTPGGFTIYGPAGLEDAHWIFNTYADAAERTGVNFGSGPQTVIVPIGVAVWLTNKEGHLADIKWGIHFSCLAGYLLHFRYVMDFQYPQGGSFYSSWGDSFPANAPFMLVKERGQDLRLEDPMHVFDSVWVYDYFSAFGGEPMTGDVEFSGPTTHSDAGHHGEVRLNHYWAVKSGSQWPGSYRRAYPVLNSETGVLAKYVVHCTRPNFSGALTMSPESIDHFIDSLFICAISPTYDTDIRPPGFYYPSDSLTFREYTRPNGRFAYHAGGGSPDRMMLRIAPESYLVPDYDPTSSKDRSVYIIGGQVYDYNQSVPLLFGDSKVSRELLVAQSIYGMNKPAVVDSTIDLYGGGTLTGKMKGYLDLEGYDGYGYFSDFGIIKQSAASEQ